MKKINLLCSLFAALLLSSSMWAANVAKIGSTEYADLATALNACQSNQTVELLSDVALTGSWTPIVNFAGTLDGKNFKITGLTINSSSDGVALIGYAENDCVVKNLTIDGANIQGTSSHVAAVVGVFHGTVENVTVKNSSVTATNGAYVGGIAGGAYVTCKNCTVQNCTITGKDQVGGIEGYVCALSITGCQSINNTITANSERAGGLFGKLECTGDNGTTLKQVNNNVVSDCNVTAPDMAGALAGQIMGSGSNFEIKNNVLDAYLSAPKTAPIGVLRASQPVAFTGALAANITGNWWSAATYAQSTYTYTAEETGTTAQVINGGVTSTETLQTVLDAATEGTTIEVPAGEYGVVYLRNTGASKTNRIMKDVTIKAATGATVKIAQIAFDCNQNNYLDIENLTIDGLEFNVPEKTAVLFDVASGNNLRVNGLTIQNCSKIGDKSQGVAQYDDAAFVEGCYDGETALMPPLKATTHSPVAIMISRF